MEKFLVIEPDAESRAAVSSEIQLTLTLSLLLPYNDGIQTAVFSNTQKNNQ